MRGDSGVATQTGQYDAPVPSSFRTRYHTLNRNAFLAWGWFA